MENPLDSLPDELLLNICQEMSDVALVNASETSQRVYNVCKEVLDERRDKRRKIKSIIDRLLSSEETTILSGIRKIIFLVFKVSPLFVSVVEELPLDVESILYSVSPKAELTSIRQEGDREILIKSINLEIKDLRELRELVENLLDLGYLGEFLD